MALDPRDCVPIPHPPEWPIVGSLFSLGGDNPVMTLAQLGEEHGEIFSLSVFNRRIVFVCSAAILSELCDESRFAKSVEAALSELREGARDGLFTAHNHEPNWGVAHRTLLPAFGPLSIASMFDSMKDIASQLVLKWARFGPTHQIAVTDDFTRLTLDTLSLCAMDYRFNSFYTEKTHPFIDAMNNFLQYADVRSRTPQFARPYLYKKREAEFFESIALMRSVAGEVIEDRLQNPKDTNDLLNAMILGKDPKTGQGLTRESMIDNAITFLVAGHETTSGMLSFIFHYLLKSKEAYRKVQEEVDEVVGSEPVSLDHLKRLPYITAVLREALRLMPTAPGFSVKAKNPQGEVLGGKYYVPAELNLIALLYRVHRDPEVYGDDADEFRPERMLDENFDKLPPTAWKPFGNGARGCIGRAFAWQEMLLVMAMLFQNFDFEPCDPDYELKISFSLTIKPKDFYMRAIPRPGVDLSGSTLGSSNAARAKASDAANRGRKDSASSGKPITILYGSNSGTCEVFARTLAADAESHGFSASKVATLDSVSGDLPRTEPIVIVTASYEGQPTDNAAQFFTWLDGLKEEDKINTSFAVFGCGHSDWKNTFHRIPTKLDNLLSKHGADRICELGLANAANGDMMSDFQTWEDTALWPALQQKYGISDQEGTNAAAATQNVSVEIYHDRASQLRSDVKPAKVIAIRTLTAPGEPEKKHIELELPSDTTYRAGDYCAVLPVNPPSIVHRVMTRFGLPFDAMLRITSRTSTNLPIKHPISAQILFGSYLELSLPATRRNISVLIHHTPDSTIKSELQACLSGDFNTLITEKRVSLLDLLERYPTITIPISTFITSLIPMRIRQYSISSSPLAHPHRLTLTYAVLTSPSTSNPTIPHQGVATTYLSTLRPNDIVHTTIKPSLPSFHLPAHPASSTTPIIMVAAGAGLAPFRGFIQERAALLATSPSTPLAPAHLFFGCRAPGKDDLYRADLDAWEKAGAVTVHRAYSRDYASDDASRGVRYVGDRVRREKALVGELWSKGAKVFVCGGREVGESVRKAFLDVARELGWGGDGVKGDEEVERWFDSVRNERYTTDVFT